MQEYVSGEGGDRIEVTCFCGPRVKPSWWVRRRYAMARLWNSAWSVDALSVLALALAIIALGLNIMRLVGWPA